MTTARLSCRQCQARKRRCDKRSPCASCELAGIQCAPVQRKRLPRGRSGVTQRRLVSLSGQLGQLQAVIATATSAVEGAAPPRADARGEVQGAVDLALWDELVDAVDGLQAIIRNAEADDAVGDDAVHKQWRSSEAQLFQSPVLAFGLENMPTIDLSRTALVFATESTLLDLYRTRVDPVFKTLHWPTAWAVMTGQPAWSKNEASAQALEDAVLFMGACSALPDECVDLIGHERNDLLQQLQARAQTSLTKSRVLQTPDMVSMQAFVTYLQALRTCGAYSTSWTLLAVAVRLSGALGLASQGSTGRSRFDVEIARRLWFSICLMDTQASMDRGLPAMIPISRVGTPPASVGDEALFVGMLAEPCPEPNSDTSMAFLTYEAMLCEKKLADRETCQLQDSPAQIWQRKLDMLAAFEETCRRNYIDTPQPHPTLPRLLVVGAAHSMIVTMRLILRRPPCRRRHANPPTWDDFDILDAGVQVLDSHLNRDDGHLSPWRWKRWIPWYALAVVLAELVHRPRDVQWQKALASARETYRRHAVSSTDVESGALWRPLTRLLRHVENLNTAAEPIAPRGSSSARCLDPNSLPSTTSAPLTDFGAERVDGFDARVERTNGAESCASGIAAATVGEDAALWSPSMWNVDFLDLWHGSLDPHWENMLL